MSYYKDYEKDLSRFRELTKLLKHPTKNFGKKSGSLISIKEAKNEYSELEEKLHDDEGNLKQSYENEIKNKKILDDEEALLNEIKKYKDVTKYVIKKEGDKVLVKPTSNEDRAILKNIEDKELKKIDKIEKALEDQSKIIEQEIKITTNDKGEKEIEIKKTTQNEKNIIDSPKYTRNQLVHRKFHEPEDSREDISEEYKVKLKNAIMIGKAGGARKILECPHCSGQMLAASVKSVKREKGPSDNTKKWLNFVAEVGQHKDIKGMTRPQILKIASALKKRFEGYPATLEAEGVKEIVQEFIKKNKKDQKTDGYSNAKENQSRN